MENKTEPPHPLGRRNGLRPALQRSRRNPAQRLGPRAAAGVFEIKFRAGVRATITLTAVWEMRITGVTAAGLAVTDSDGEPFCDRVERGACIHEVALSSVINRSDDTAQV